MTREERRLANVYNKETRHNVEVTYELLGLLVGILFGILNAYFYFLSVYKTEREELKSLGEKEVLRLWARNAGLPEDLFDVKR